MGGFQLGVVRGALLTGAFRRVLGFAPRFVFGGRMVKKKSALPFSHADIRAIRKYTEEKRKADSNRFEIVDFWFKKVSGILEEIAHNTMGEPASASPSLTPTNFPSSEAQSKPMSEVFWQNVLGKLEEIKGSMDRLWKKEPVKEVTQALENGYVIFGGKLCRRLEQGGIGEVSIRDIVKIFRRRLW